MVLIARYQPGWGESLAGRTAAGRSPGGPRWAWTRRYWPQRSEPVLHVGGAHRDPLPQPVSDLRPRCRPRPGPSEADL